MPQKFIVINLPFSRGEGFGHVMRESTMAQAIHALGYKTILLSDGNPDDLKGAMRESFDRAYDQVVRQEGRWPNAAELERAKALGPIAGIIVDNYRDAGKRAEFIRNMRGLCGRDGIFMMVDGIEGLEFDAVNKIFSIEFATPDYPPEIRAKLIHGPAFTLTSPDFLTPVPLPEPLPEGRTCAFIFGSSDPLNVASQAIAATVGLGLSPVLLAPKKSPHAAAYAAALAKHPRSLWLDTTLSRGQIHALLRGVSCSVITPNANMMHYHLHCRTPFVALNTNPSTHLNTDAAERMGLPVIRLDAARTAAHWGKDETVLFEEIPAQLPAAIKKLEALGYLAGRLPERPPFDVTLDADGPMRILKAAGF